MDLLTNKQNMWEVVLQRIVNKVCVYQQQRM
jgi:hypothetical protein